MVERLTSRGVRFSDFVLDVPAFELRQQGRRIRMERRPMELLMLLVNRRGDLVTRDEIVHGLWGGCVHRRRHERQHADSKSPPRPA
jgi:DNA-binding winged helix-turn-helix (wHTH) protein